MAKPKTDRIDKAALLIRNNRVVNMTVGDIVRFHVQSDAQAIGYEVTPGCCPCADLVFPCKHLWATEGNHAAELIADLRAAQTVDQLYDIGATYSERLMSVPAFYANAARSEFARRRAEIRSGYQKPLMPQTPLKPQPKTATRTRRLREAM